MKRTYTEICREKYQANCMHFQHYFLTTKLMDYSLKDDHQLLVLWLSNVGQAQTLLGPCRDLILYDSLYKPPKKWHPETKSDYVRTFKLFSVPVSAVRPISTNGNTEPCTVLRLWQFNRAAITGLRRQKFPFLLNYAKGGNDQFSARQPRHRKYFDFTGTKDAVLLPQITKTTQKGRQRS